MPVSPSMEKQLHEIVSTSGSQDSITSTGSNQELKTQLESTIAEVEAIAEHLEKQKTSPTTETGSVEIRPKTSPSGSPPTAAPKPSLRRVSSGGESATSAPTNQPTPTPRTIRTDDGKEPKEEKVFLRQSSWASREQIVAPGIDISGDDNESSAPRRTSTSSLGATSNGGLFAKNRSLWERRSSQQNVSTASNVDDASDDGGHAVRGGFRSNRDFWEQRVTMRQKQTPDLVLDLPVNTLSTSPGAASVASASATSPTAAVAPIPKPRPRPSVDRTVESGASKNGSSSGDENAADQFAKSDRNTLKKIRNEASSASASASAEVVEIAAARRTAIQAKGRVPTPKQSAAESTQK